MPVYTVHGPLGELPGRPRSDRLVFIRDGFHVWAALFGPLWLIAHRLWLALVFYVIGVAVLGAALALLHVDPESRTVIALLVMLLTGFEAASLQRWSYARGNWQLLDVVVAKNRDDAEHRFFTLRSEAGSSAAPVDRGAPPPVRPSTGGAGPYGDIVGLFPTPGTPR